MKKHSMQSYLAFLRNRPQLVLVFIALVLLLLTFTKPTLELERPSYRYVFVFDISQSMNVMDVPASEASISRLEYAKQTTLASLSDMPCGTEAGLALFTGHRAFLLITPVEICSNYRELSTMLNNIDWHMTWDASSKVAKGLFKSIKLLSLLEKNTRLVFISDGQEAPPIDPQLPPRFPGKLGEINGIVIGVGGDELVPIPKFNKKTGEAEGNWTAEQLKESGSYGREGSNVGNFTEHLSSLKQSYLQDLAEQTGLSYYRLSDADDLTDQLRSSEFSKAKVVNTDVRWLFALAALMALISSLLIEPIRRLL